MDRVSLLTGEQWIFIKQLSPTQVWVTVQSFTFHDYSITAGIPAFRSMSRDSYFIKIYNTQGIYAHIFDIRLNQEVRLPESQG